MSESILLGVGAFFSLASVAFFAAAIAASSTNFDTLKAVGWVTATSDGVDVYVGFKAAAQSISMGSTTVERVVKLTDCKSDDKVCNACGGDGGITAMALDAIALAFSFLSLIFIIVRISSAGNAMIKIVQIVMAGLAFVFGVAAFASYTNCSAELADSFDGLDVAYGAGFGLCVTGAVLMIVTTIVSVIPSGGHKSTPVSTSG